LKWSEGVELTVSEATPQALKVTPVNDSLPKGLTKAFKAELLYSDGKVVDVTAEPAWSWSSNDRNIATVDSDTGVVTAVNDGLVTITISGEMDGVKLSEEVYFTVSKEFAESLLNIEPGGELVVGQSRELKAQLRYSDGSVFDVTREPTASWASLVTERATIDSDTGIVTALKSGTAVIEFTWSFNDETFKQIIDIKVITQNN
ncbi:Ig-like domain-containing protein, partial [Vibrio alginolyticus]